MVDGAAAAEHRLGVLFVHGIGMQRRGQTLATWADPLVGWLGYELDTRIELTDGLLTESETGEPAQAVAALSVDGEEQTWLLAEGFWADAFEAPTFREVWAWGFPVIPAVLVSHVGASHSRLRARAALSGRIGRRWSLIRASATAGVLAFLSLAVLTPVLIGATTVLLLLGVIPSNRVRSFVGRAQRSLMLTMGDSQTLIESPTRRAALTGEVTRSLSFLEQRCESVVVVAHSQGAAVAHQVLATGRHPKTKNLVTLGSGLNKLRYLELAREPTAAVRRQAFQLHWMPTILFMGAVLSFLGFLASSADWTDLAAMAAVLLGGSVLIGAVASVAGRRAGPVAAVLGLILLGGLIALVITTDEGGYPLVLVGTVFFLIATTIQASAAKTLIISPDLADHLDRWLDIWSTRDPVPNGPTVTMSFGWPDTRPIVNTKSIIRDHTAYATNTDVAVPLVGLELLAVAQGRSTLAKSIAVHGDQRERDYRMTWKRILSALGLTVGGVYALRTWSSGRERVGAWYCDLTGCGHGSGWLPDDISGRLADELSDESLNALLVGGYVVVTLAVLFVLGSLWAMWDRWERLLDRDHEVEERNLDTPPGLIGLVIVLSLLLLGALVARWPEADLRIIGGIAFSALLVFAFVNTYGTRLIARFHRWFIDREMAPSPTLVDHLRLHAEFLDFRRDDPGAAHAVIGALRELGGGDTPFVLDARARLLYRRDRDEAQRAEGFHRRAIEQLDDPYLIINYVGFLLAESRDVEAAELIAELRGRSMDPDVALELCLYELIIAPGSEASRTSARETAKKLLDRGVKIEGMDYDWIDDRTAPSGAARAEIDDLVAAMTRPRQR